MEFIIINQGGMTYHVNGELVKLAEGNGIMVTSRQLHYGFSNEHTECEFTCILLSPALLSGNEWFYQNYIEPVTENPLYPYLHLDGEPWKISILENLQQLSKTASLQRELPYFLLLEKFVSIMDILHQNLDTENYNTAKESPDLTFLRNMVTYIEEHYSQRITLEEIASAGACCKSKCSSLFKKYLRETPIAYIAKLRLQKSLSALLNSDKSITDTAYEHGFCGASYYCETFQKYYGTSTLQCRKNQA